MTNEHTADRVTSQKPTKAASVWFGLVLVALGVLLTLNRLDMAPLADIAPYWPITVIGAGAAKMYDSWGTPQAGSGLGLMTTGLWFLLVNFRIFGLTLQNAWPLFIVGLGVSIVWRAFVEERGGKIRREDTHGR